MDEVAFGVSDLRQAARYLKKRSDTPLNGGQIRMTFPCHVAIRLRSGGVLETDGRERGGSGAPLEEQEQVVSEKFALVRDAAEMPKAWRRRPTPAASSA